MELLLQLLHASHQPAASGTGSAEGRKLINEQMIYGDREKIERIEMRTEIASSCGGYE